MIKVTKSIVLLSILSFIMIGCSSSDTGQDNYFGYSNEPEPPKQENIETTQGQYNSSGGSGKYVTRNEAQPSYASQSNAGVSYNVYQYYDYYDPYYDTPFVPWRLSHLDSYARYNQPGFDIYITNRPYWWYDHYEPWRSYRYYHHYNHHYNHGYAYSPYGYGNWHYYRRYYNPYSYQARYIPNDRSNSRETMRGFGASRGTYSGDSRGTGRTTGANVSGARGSANSRGSGDWEGLYDDNPRSRESDANSRTGRRKSIRVEDQEARPVSGSDARQSGNFRTPERRESNVSPENNRARSTNQQEYKRSNDRNSYTSPPSRSRYSSPSKKSSRSSSGSREYKNSSGSRSSGSYSSPSRSSTRSSGSSSSRRSSGSSGSGSRSSSSENSGSNSRGR